MLRNYLVATGNPYGYPCQAAHLTHLARTANGERRTAMIDRPLRLLLSYHYYKDENLDELLGCFPPELKLDIFADSGAWSAFSVGAPVVAAEYVAWVERWKHHFSVAAGPDVIGDAAATCSATERMIARGLGLPVLPTFHVGEDWDYLDRYAAMADYIAFGGMVPLSTNRTLLAAWCRQAFARLPDGVRVHGFGMTTWPVLCAFPWHSVDSSSWTSCFRYARLALFDAVRGRFSVINMRSPPETLAAAPLLATYDLRPTDVQAKTYDRDRVCAASVRAWQRAEDWLNTHVFLASTAIADATPSGPRALGRAVSAYLALNGNPPTDAATDGRSIRLACRRPAGPSDDVHMLSRVTKGKP